MTVEGERRFQKELIECEAVSTNLVVMPDSMCEGKRRDPASR